MSVCEECWNEASRKALTFGGFTAEYYLLELDAHPEHATNQSDDDS